MSDPTPQLEALRRQNAALDREGFDLHSLVKAGAALHNEIDLDSVCELLIAMVRERTRVAQVAVLVHDDTTHAVRVVAASNLPELPEGLAFPADDGLLWRMVLAGDPISVVDISGNPRFPEMFHASGIGDLEALTWVPLVTPGHVVGVLTLGKCPDGGHVSPGDLGFVTQLARQAAVALNRAQLYSTVATARADLDRSLHKLSMLFDVTRALGEVDNLTNLLQMILERATSAAQAQKGSLMLLDTETDDLVVRVVLGLPDKEVERQINEGEIACSRFRRGEGVAGKVLETGRTLRIDDTDGHTDFAQRDASNVQSILCVPLNVDNETIGVLNITNRLVPEPFGLEDEEILDALAHQAAVAIARTRLYEAATLDALTGLYVRRFITHKLDAEVRRASRYGTPLSLIMCDLDHFKSVNDTYGHPAGDAVLSTVAAVFGKQLRTDIDFAGRYGGEEFLVVLPHTGAEAACVAGERLRSAIERLSIDVGTDAPLKVTASFGLSELDTAGADTAEALVKRADQALYDSKRSGRNRISVRPPPTADGPGADGPGADGPGADGDATA